MGYRYSIVPRFTDFDAYGIVHHSNYLRYVEEARFAFFREQLNTDLSSFLDNDYKIVISDIKCKYIRSITTNEPIIIDVYFVFVGNSYVRCDFKILDITETMVFAKGYTKHSFIDVDFKLMYKYPLAFKEMLGGFGESNKGKYYEFSEG